ncbi:MULTISPECIES: ANTAR domain-containing protein [unclassified Nocardia]|uniref:PAS and ANTAR domain-containing protein n=1 Tax=unclassified Nocardia TaxID=2637762 RepID=UPI0024A95671|nr:MULTISPECIES: ANTAR domain-containing protein [unclassified Nocardia]
MTDTVDPARDTSPFSGATGEPNRLTSNERGFGSFRFWFATQRWEWSPEVYRMHGYAPGEIEPTTELLLAHKHPDDREQVAEAIARSLTQGQPFSSRHRFLDTVGVEHRVMLVADHILDATGTPVGTSGYYIDLSDTLAEVERETLDSVIPEVVENRAAIEQAKGVLMRMYDINSDQAFKVLKWRSQETNTKLRDLAEALLNGLHQLPPPPPNTVAAFDHLLLTIHEQIR